jgi:PTS system nitrogen regulatory IIA component
MKLYSLLNENHVLLEAKVGDLESALTAMIEVFGASLPDERTDELVALLMDRERQYPTHIDGGVYVPHCRLEWLEVFLFGLLVPDKPIPHSVVGQEPIAMFFMILAPQTKNTMMLQTLAGIARVLRSKETRQALLGQRSPERAIRIIENTGVDVRRTLVAADIMTPVTHTVTIDMVLARAVDVLVKAPDEGVPVIDKHGKLVGELTSKELMVLGMPNYIGVLANSAILDNFEPFENFFQHENHMTVREICRRDVVQVTPDAPVVQVSHLMMTHQKRRVYVVEDGELKGMIFRKVIIERVLHI